MNLKKSDFQIQGEREAGYWFYLSKYPQKKQVKELINQILKWQEDEEVLK